MFNEAFDLLCELAQIPAPSGKEEKRAAFCKEWLENQGAQNVTVDSALNVILPIGDLSGDLTVIMAHSDVVFPDMEKLPLRVADGKIYCPGVGDDTANVVCLLMAAKHIIKNRPVLKKGGMLIVINSCEEGLGNLRGCREIMRVYGDRVKEFISFDGSIYSIHNKAVGSRRYRIEIKTEGGHSYGAFGNRNAIACLSSLIDRLYKIQVPPIGKTTYNVGLISGGTSVNTIAQNAEALFEFRSDEREALDIMQSYFDKEISETDGEVTVSLIGDRPCAGDIPPEKLDALCKKIADTAKRVCGVDVKYTPGSTDCNIPSSMGIPAISVGCIVAKKAHTREEFVEIDSIEPGLRFALEVLMSYFE